MLQLVEAGVLFFYSGKHFVVNTLRDIEAGVSFFYSGKHFVVSTVARY